MAMSINGDMASVPLENIKLPEKLDLGAKMLPCCLWLFFSLYKRSTSQKLEGPWDEVWFLCHWIPTETSSGCVPQLQKNFITSKGETRTNLCTWFMKLVFLFFSTNPLFLPSSPPSSFLPSYLLSLSSPFHSLILNLCCCFSFLDQNLFSFSN